MRVTESVRIQWRSTAQAALVTLQCTGGWKGRETQTKEMMPSKVSRRQKRLLGDVLPLARMEDLLRLNAHAWPCFCMRAFALMWSKTSYRWSEEDSIKGPDVSTPPQTPHLPGPSRHISVMAPNRSWGLLVHTQCPSIGTLQRVSEGCFTSYGLLCR